MSLFSFLNKKRYALAASDHMLRGSRAFTLIETFVAISVLMASLVGPLTVSQKSLALSGYSRDKMTAYYLAQDAMEYIRGVRDDNAKQGNAWSQFADRLSPCLITPSNVGCTLDSSQIFGINVTPGLSTIQPCGLQCGIMTYNAWLGLYTVFPPDDNNVATIFTRTITVFPMPSDPTGAHEIGIGVQVTWTNDGIAQSYSLKQDLFDW